MPSIKPVTSLGARITPVPSSAKRWAIPFPIPRLAPVIRRPFSWDRFIELTPLMFAGESDRIKINLNKNAPKDIYIYIEFFLGCQEWGQPFFSEVFDASSDPHETIPDVGNALRTMLAKLTGSKHAPPTNAPSISFSPINARAFSGLTLPPYWIRTLSAVVRPKAEIRTDLIKA